GVVGSIIQSRGCAAEDRARREAGFRTGAILSETEWNRCRPFDERSHIRAWAQRASDRERQAGHAAAYFSRLGRDAGLRRSANRIVIRRGRRSAASLSYFPAK